VADERYGLHILFSSDLLSFSKVILVYCKGLALLLTSSKMMLTSSVGRAEKLISAEAAWS